MKRLYRHQLQSDLASEYVRKNLENVNALSMNITNSTNWKKGLFFTLLPEGSNLEQIHSFKTGGLLPQHPIKNQTMINKSGVLQKSYFQEVPKIEYSLSKAIFEKLNSSINFSCIFDDASGLVHQKFPDIKTLVIKSSDL